MAPPFTLRTLGVPLLQTATGEAVRFRTRKHFALAIRLAVEPGRPLTRDHLLELFWGDAPEQRGRHSLAQAITVLKSRLGRSNVLIHKSTVALAPGIVDADVTHLEACDTTIGGRFLEGFEIPRARAFEDWRDAWHAKLLPKLRDCLVRQMDAGRRVGDFETVERHARVLGELEPLSEDALRGIMEARAWVGDRTNALKAYAEFEGRLAVELGARPNPDLVRIANLLREGRRSPYRQPKEPAPESGEKRFEPERLIGREKEFGQLYDAWASVRKRRPSVIVLTGEPGIGKTTLTNAFVSTCQMEGAVVARAQAYDAERELPFALLSELVRQLTIQRAIGSADPSALSDLSRISSEILVAFPGVCKPTEWPSDVVRLRLADSFFKTVTAAAEDNPLVLVVDDLHASDDASAAILHLLARKLDTSRVLLLLIGRSNELRGSGSSAALSSDLSILRMRTLELDPLSDSAAARMIEKLGIPSHSFGTAVRNRIIAASKGYPLALELLVREWQQHGPGSLLTDIDRLNTLPAVSLGIPRAIRTVFEHQVRRLDRTTRSVLDLAAVLGRRLNDLSLYEVVDLLPGTAARSLSTLCEAGLLREIHGGIEFRNELIRAQAYYAIAVLTRHHLHNGVATKLAAGITGSEWALEIEVAWHFMRAGAAEPAVEHALNGAEAALSSGAPQEAEKLLQALVDLPLETSVRRQAKLLWCRSLVDQSRAQVALPALEELLQTPDVLSQRELAEASMLRASAEYLLHRETGRGHFVGSQVALDRARTVQDPTLLAQALFEYARSGAESGDETRVCAARNELESLAASDNPDPVLGLAHYGLGYCLYFLYEVQSATEHLRTAIEFLGHQDTPTLGRVYTGLGNCLHSLCDIGGSRAAFERGLRIAQRLGDDSRASVNASNLSAIMLLAGDFEAAIRWGRESAEMGERSLNQPMLQNSYGNLTEAYLLSGMLDEALESRERARRWVRDSRNWLTHILHTAEDGCHELVLGNWARALDLSRQAERMATGRERAVPGISSYVLLKTLRIRETDGCEQALQYATEATNKYQNRFPLAFLGSGVVELSLTDSSSGRAKILATETSSLFDLVPGRRVLYRAMGLVDE